MVEFNLSNAHPDFQRDVPAILAPLIKRYPGAKLLSVSLYGPIAEDTSMAGTYPGAEIRLNAYWFGRSPVAIQRASKPNEIEVGGVTKGWHGPMVAQPEHLLNHEFGHVVGLSLPQHEVEEWMLDRWQRATRDPSNAPSGYALTSPDEFFGEMFALVHLGFATDDEASDLHNLIGRLQ